jgi:hypothetical protein
MILVRSNSLLKAFYVIYNIIYQCFGFIALVFAATYINDFLIPYNLKWENGRLRNDLTNYTIVGIGILVVEVILLLLVIYGINKAYLIKVLKSNIPSYVANWTLSMNLILTLLAVIFIVFLSYRT